MNLKPCPSCERDLLHTGSTYAELHQAHKIQCVACGVTGPLEQTIDLAEQAWNALPRHHCKALLDEVKDLIPLAIETCKSNRGSGPGDEHRHWNEKIRKLEVRLKELANE